MQNKTRLSHPSALDSPADVMADFKLINSETEPLTRLGGGSFGQVFKRKEKDGNEYAEKQISIGKFKETRRFRSEADIERLFQEVRILSSLQHSNVVRYYSSSVTGPLRHLYQRYLTPRAGFLEALKTEESLSSTKIISETERQTYIFIKMELCHQDLRVWLNDRKTQRSRYEALEDICRISSQILTGLNYIHQNGVIHRDLKPDNIFLQKTNNRCVVKIGDFGLARYFKDDSDARYTNEVGTPAYQSPEMHHDFSQAITAKTDIFSVGLIFFETLWAIPEEVRYRIFKSRKFDFPAEFISHFPKPYKLVRKMLEENAETRISAEESLRIVNSWHPCDLSKQVNSGKLDVKTKLDLAEIKLFGRWIEFSKLFQENPKENEKNWRDEILEIDGVKTNLISDKNIVISNYHAHEFQLDNSCYIKRFFYRRILLSWGLFSSNLPNHFTIGVSGISKSKFEVLLTQYGRKNDIRRENIVFLDKGNEHETFDRISSSLTEFGIHWVHITFQNSNPVETPIIEWKKTRGKLGSLREYILKTEMDNLGETIKESAFLNGCMNRVQDSHKVIILSDTAGMGKSTVVRNIYQKLTKTHPAIWGVYVDLNNITAQLAFFATFIIQSKENTLSEIDQCINFLSKDILRLSSEFEQKLFMSRFYTENSIVIFFDGFDEVSPTYSKAVIFLIKSLRKTKVVNIWVTTRPSFRSKLEDLINDFSFSLKPFSVKNQIDFLVKCWKTELEIKTEDESHDGQLHFWAKQLLQDLKNNVNDSNQRFAEIPLQGRLLAETFSHDVKNLIQSNSSDRIHLGKHFTLPNLYERFVDKKYNIYRTEKKKEIITNLAVDEDNDDTHKLFLKRHKLAALFAFYNEGLDEILLDVDEANDTLKKIENGHRAGIILGVVGKKPQFVHRTFAEYFCALYFHDEMKRRRQCPSLTALCPSLITFVKSNIFSEENEILRRFFDYFFTKNQTQAKQFLSNVSIKHELDETQIDLQFDSEGRSELHLSASYGYETKIKSMKITREQITQKDALFEFSPVQYAAIANKWAVVELFLRDFASCIDFANIIDFATSRDKSGMTALHKACQLGFVQLTKAILSEISADKFTSVMTRATYATTMNQKEVTPLDLAITYGFPKIVEILVKELSGVLSSSSNSLLTYTDDLESLKSQLNLSTDRSHNFSVLHRCAHSTSGSALPMMKLVVDNHLVNVNISDILGNTPLHEVLYIQFYCKNKQRHCDIMEYLIGQGANPHIASYQGITVVAQAAFFQNPEGLDFLLGFEGVSPDPDIEISSERPTLNLGLTPIQAATLSGCFEAVDILLKRNVKLDSKANTLLGKIHLNVFHLAALLPTNVPQRKQILESLLSKNDEYHVSSGSVSNQWIDINREVHCEGESFKSFFEEIIDFAKDDPALAQYFWLRKFLNNWGVKQLVANISYTPSDIAKGLQEWETLEIFKARGGHTKSGLFGNFILKALNKHFRSRMNNLLWSRLTDREHYRF